MLLCMHMVMGACGHWLKEITGSERSGGTLWQAALALLRRGWWWEEVGCMLGIRGGHMPQAPYETSWHSP